MKCENLDFCAYSLVESGDFDRNRCHNKSTCINLDDRFICQCEDGFFGQYCDKTEESIDNEDDLQVPQSPFCRCENGIGKLQASCSETENYCQSCDEYYHLEENINDSTGSSSCQENQCYCDHGTAVNTSDCTINNSHHCQSCDTKNRYYLPTNNNPNYPQENKICTKMPNICKCENGIAVDHYNCLEHDLNYCFSCDAGFSLNFSDRTCHKIELDPNCEVRKDDDIFTCEICYENYHLDKDEENLPGICQPNICNCPYDASLTPDLSQCFKNNQEICLTVKFLEIEMTISTNNTDYQILVEKLLNDLRTLSKVILGPKIRFQDIVVINVPDNYTPENAGSRKKRNIFEFTSIKFRLEVAISQKDFTDDQALFDQILLILTRSGNYQSNQFKLIIDIDEKQGFNRGQRIGIVFGGLVGLVLVVFVFAWVRQRRKRKVYHF